MTKLFVSSLEIMFFLFVLAVFPILVYLFFDHFYWSFMISCSLLGQLFWSLTFHSQFQCRMMWNEINDDMTFSILFFIFINLLILSLYLYKRSNIFCYDLFIEFITIFLIFNQYNV